MFVFINHERVLSGTNFGACQMRAAAYSLNTFNFFYLYIFIYIHFEIYILNGW